MAGLTTFGKNLNNVASIRIPGTKNFKTFKDIYESAAAGVGQLLRYSNAGMKNLATFAQYYAGSRKEGDNPEQYARNLASIMSKHLGQKISPFQEITPQTMRNPVFAEALGLAVAQAEGNHKIISKLKNNPRYASAVAQQLAKEDKGKFKWFSPRDRRNITSQGVFNMPKTSTAPVNTKNTQIPETFVQEYVPAAPIANPEYNNVEEFSVPLLQNSPAAYLPFNSAYSLTNLNRLLDTSGDAAEELASIRPEINYMNWLRNYSNGIAVTPQGVINNLQDLSDLSDY